MSYLATTLQQELATAARDLLQKEAAASTAEPERAYAPELWSRVVDLGWASLTVREGLGGLGRPWADLGAVLVEAGSVLLGVPLADTATAAWLIDELTGGDTQPALGVDGRSGTVAFGADVTATSRGSSVRLRGTATFVLHGATADVVLLPARLDGEDGVLVLEAGDLPTGSRRAVPLADRTRPVGDLLLDDVELSRTAILSTGPSTTGAVAVARALRAACSCAEAVGGIDRLLEMSVLYACERHQFGRPIGSFQAIQHQLADMLIAAEEARTATLRLLAADPADPRYVVDAAVARTFTADSYQAVASTTVHVHGGVGFTWEHPAHLYLKRAAADRLLTWPATDCRAAVRASLFDEGVAPE